MVYNQVLETKTIDLDKIYLDPNNPRFFDVSRGEVQDSRIIEETVQDRAFETLIDKFDVEALAQIIKKMGFLKIHRVVVREVAGQSNVYVVVEGNRRIAACRYLKREHLAGVTLSDEIYESIENIEALAYTGTDHAIAWDIQGINHIIGIKPWPPYNQACHLVKKMEEGNLGLSDVARAFGMSSTKAGRMIRAYHALLQLKEDTDYGSRAKNEHYSYFEEVMKKPDVKNWLGWDDTQRRFADETNLRKFYSWFLPEEDEEKKLPMAIDVRKLPPILQSPDVLARFNDTLSLIDAQREVGQTAPPVTVEETTRALDRAKNIIDSVSSGVMREHGNIIRTKLQQIVAAAQAAIDQCG